MCGICGYDMGYEYVNGSKTPTAEQFAANNQKKNSTIPLKEPISGTNTAIENTSMKKVEPQFVFAPKAEKVNTATTNSSSTNFVEASLSWARGILEKIVP